jgi:hypothetical protein
VEEGVLYLHGQYLFDYESMDEEDQTRPRRFPGSEFTVLKDLRDADFLHIVPRGTVFEPEIIARPNDQKLRKLAGKLQDGQLLTTVTLEQISSTVA